MLSIKFGVFIQGDFKLKSSFNGGIIGKMLR